jgi:hypothetical protein
LIPSQLFASKRRRGGIFLTISTLQWPPAWKLAVASGDQVIERDLELGISLIEMGKLA